MSQKTKQMKHTKKVLTKGNIWPYVLSLLSRKKQVYAYELDDLLDKEFGFKPGKIMLYMVLYSLDNNGLVESHFEKRRKYYKITDKGKNELIKFKKYARKMLKKL